MLPRSVIGLCTTAGLIVGGFVPDLWGAGFLSLSSVVFGVVGGIAGLWLGVKLSE